MTANVNKIPPHGKNHNLLMFNKLAVLFCLIFLFYSFAAFAQGSNSINISILGCGNYSAKLSDYYSPKNAGMLTVIVRNTDFKDPYLQIQLYMSVTNGLKTYIQTKSPNISKTFQIGSGETLTLTGQDLECIFNTYYLNYKKSNFQDGQNILKIYARDTRTGKIVSNTAQILLKSVMIAPPKLTSPDDNFTIENDNQFVNFTWRGDNGGANIATRCNYRYKFELWKQNINDKNVEAQRHADFTMENLFDEKYQFLLANFPFEIGQKYCWRVTAYDPFEKATFLQNGKSEVRSFIYKHLPVPVTGLKHKINERNRQATVTWNAAEGHTKYYVEYYNPQTTKTIAMEKDEPKFTLASAPEKEYTILFRVKAQCWGDDSRCSNWSDWDTIKYAAPQIVEPKYPCGYQFPKVEITNFELKTDFKEGDIVSESNGSSDYEIINCKSDGDGVLQGQFYLIMNAWGGAKIACEFWDTKINTDNQIITTRYRSIDTPVGMVEPEELANYVKSLWLDGNSLATSSKIRDTIVIDQKFDYLYRRESGEFVAVVVNSDGSTTETEFDLHKNPSQTLITDGKGDSLVYSQNGQVMGIKEYRATGGNAALLKDYHRKSDSLAQWKINFLPDTATQIYGFDYLGSGNHGIYSGSEYYPYLSANYDLRYKSVECYKTDNVIVDFGSYPEKDSVVFKDKYGVTLKLSKGNVLNFTGVAKPDTNYIYAYRGDKKLGKLSVNTYKPQIKQIEFVRVNGAKIDKSITAEALSKIFNCAAVNFKIEIKSLDIPSLKTFTHGGSNWHSVYNDDQKKVLEAYDSLMKDDKFYLFFVDNVLNKKDSLGTSVSGYMPRGYNCGFIYDGGSPHTIAHELGHGIAGLEHVFENSKSSGKTKNLMDYASGEELWHFQWDEIQDPSRVWMKWNKDESEGENVEKKIGEIISVKLTCDKNDRIQLYEDNGSEISNDDLNYEFDGKKYIQRSFAVLKSSEITVNIKFELLEPFANAQVELFVEFSRYSERKLKKAKKISFEISCPKGDNLQYEVNKTIKLDDCIDYYDKMDLYLVDTQNKKSLIGSTNNKIMVMNHHYANPKFKLFETIADIGCRNAFGQKEPQNIVDAIWNDFAGLRLKNVKGEELYYWKDVAMDDGTANDYSYLLRYNKGTCKAWADLFYYVLKFQGISDVALYQIRSRYPELIDSPNEYLSIKSSFTTKCASGVSLDDIEDLPIGFDYQWKGDNINCNLSDNKCAPGQNNPFPPCRFLNHYVIVWNNYLYDPSYGNRFIHTEDWDDVKNQPESEWERNCLGYFVMKKLSNRFLYAKPNDPNKRELRIYKTDKND